MTGAGTQSTPAQESEPAKLSQLVAQAPKAGGNCNGLLMLTLHVSDAGAHGRV